MPLTSIHPRTGKLPKTEKQLSKERNRLTRKKNKWNYTHTRRFVIAFNKKTEKDMLDWLEAHGAYHYQTAIKRLIRAEMEREGQTHGQGARKAK